MIRLRKIRDSLFRSSKKTKEDEDENYDDFLCRFVLDGSGETIGESIAVDEIENIMIIKSEEKYLGVPLKHIEPNGKTLLVKGLVDTDKAVLMGEKWRRESHYEIKHTEESD